MTLQDDLEDASPPPQDITSLQAEVVAGDLQVTLRCAQPLGLAGTWGHIFIDTDLNPDTPVDRQRMGADCTIFFTLSQGFSPSETWGTAHVTLDEQTFTVGERGTSLTARPDGLSLSLPTSLWGGNTALRLFATSAEFPIENRYDRAPDHGWLDLPSGLIVIPRPGNEQVHVRYDDPGGAATVPDLTRLETTVTNGNLLVWLTFGHGLTFADLQASQQTLFINVKLDLDKRLWSGLGNNMEDPPTFGIDRRLEIMLSHLSYGQPSATLLMLPPDDPNDPYDELLRQPTGVPIGHLEYDTLMIVGADRRFGTSSNQLYLSIPLAHLDYDEGETFMMVDAFTMDHMDSIPASGAIDTTPGLPQQQIVHPVDSCAETEVTHLDPANDSMGFGLQGDELVGSRACPLVSGGLRITADLESLEPSDACFVNLRVDSDGNAATGVLLQNETPEEIGVDLLLSCKVAEVVSDIVIVDLLDLRNPPLEPKLRPYAKQLVTLHMGGSPHSGQRGAWYTITLPPDLLDPSPGATARFTLDTRLRGAEADIAPNSAFYTVSAPSAPPLRVSSVVPSTGAAAGGTRVSIYGSSFARNSQVWFGGVSVPAQNCRLVTYGELSVLTPASPPGLTTVTVRNPDSGAVAYRTNAFRFGPAEAAAPVVRGVDPALGPIRGGNRVRLAGVNFLPGTVVRFGSAMGSDLVVESPFSLTATVPAGAAGAADVTVVNSSGKGVTLRNGYNYGSRPPVVWTVIPNFGPLTGGTEVAIMGENFQAGCGATIGGVALSGMTLVNDRLLTGRTAPSGKAGLQDVAVVTPDGVRGTLPAAFDYGGMDPGISAPLLLGVSPLWSPTEGGATITVLSLNLEPGLAVLFDNVPARIHSFDPLFQDLEVEVVAPPHATGPVAVTVLNPDGQGATFPAGDPGFSFWYVATPPPIPITGVWPMESATEGGQTVTITSEVLEAGATVEFGGFPAVITSVTKQGATVVPPPHPPGPVSIRVTNPDGQSVLWERDPTTQRAFAFVGATPAAPMIDSISPTEGSQLGGEEVTLQGHNFFAGVRVFFGGSSCPIVQRTSTTSLRVRTQPASPGTVPVRVVNSDNQAHTRSNAFTYLAPIPVINGISPNAGPTAGGTRVWLSGSGFLQESQVSIGGNQAMNTAHFDQGNLSVVTPPGLPGQATITIVNPGSRVGSLANAFSYQGTSGVPPRVFSVIPDKGGVDGGTAIAITGENFLAGAGVSVGGRPLTQVQIRSLTLLTGLTPPGSAGAATLVMTNPDGQSASLPGGFTYLSTNTTSGQPRLSIAGSAMRALQLRADGESGMKWVLEAGTNLAHWTPLGEVQLNTWLSLEQFVPTWRANGHLFLRAVSGVAQTNVAPVITTTPEGETVAVGETVSLSVIATGTPPLGYQWLRNGAKLLNSDRVAGATTDKVTISNVQLTDAGAYAVWVSNAVATVSSLEVPLVVTPPPGLTLSDALDNMNLVWDTGGSSTWIAQTNTTHDLSDAAESGPIANGQATWLETSLTGPGSLTFWWKVSSESGSDWLDLLVDGTLQDGWSGETGWERVVLPISSGMHTLRWQYSKEGPTGAGQDRGWVDQVTFTPGSG